jgi:O-antigen/teichoic acid export membrane protein
VTIRSATAERPNPILAEREADRPLPQLRSVASREASGVASAPTVKTPSLRVNFAWTLAGNICNAACTWLIVVVIVKLGSMELAGVYAFAQAIVLPVVSFSTLQLRGIYATDATNQYRFGHYLGLRLLTTSLAMIVITGLAFASSRQPEVQLLTLAIGLISAIEAISDIIYGALQQHERMQWIAISMIVRSCLGMAAIFAGLLITNSLVFSMLASAGVRALVVLFLDVPLGVRTLAGEHPKLREVFRQARDSKVLRTLTWLSLPLAPSTMLMTLQVTIPRYLIEHWLDSRQLGIFAAQSYLANAGAIVATALAQSAAPRLSQHYLASDVRAYTRLLAKLAGLGAAYGAVGIAMALLCGRPVLSALYAPECAERNDIFVCLMVAAALAYVSILLGWALTAARWIRIQLPLFTSIVAIMFASGCLLVPRYGLEGAAATVLLGAFIQAVASLFFVTLAVRSFGPSAGRLSSEEACA